MKILLQKVALIATIVFALTSSPVFISNAYIANTYTTVNLKNRYTIKTDGISLTAYDFRQQRLYGYFNECTIDFEGECGIGLSVNKNVVTITGYDHTKSDYYYDLSLEKLSDSRWNSDTIRNIATITVKKYATLSFKKTDTEGIYIVRAKIHKKGETEKAATVDGYLYYDGKNAQTCRLTNIGTRINEYDNFQSIMADADPENYLDNSKITYPTSGIDDRVVHVKDFERISDDLVDDSWSEEYKVLTFTNYILNNYAYDSYRYNTLKMVSRANIVGIYNSDKYYALGNHVGVCWDFTNMMVIMCRHHGIPATSVEGKDHTATAVYLNGEWTMIDVTLMTKYDCYKEDVDPDKWRKGYSYPASECYGCYTLRMPIQSHDNEVWTAEAIKKHAK